MSTKPERKKIYKQLSQGFSRLWLHNWEGYISFLIDWLTAYRGQHFIRNLFEAQKWTMGRKNVNPVVTLDSM